MPKNWVDFREIRETVGMEMVLDHYRIDWLRKSGEELRGRCPIHKGEGERSFHASLEKNVFHCFSCGAKGNVLDFVAAMEETGVREAALKLKEWFGAGEKRPATNPVRRVRKPQPEEPAAPAAVNPPLEFELKVDPSHEYGSARGLERWTLERFGAGMCLSKGLFAERFVVPIHAAAGRLVAYAGRSVDGREPKYLFPSSEKGFRKRFLLFNLHRVIETGWIDRVVLAEGFFDCMKVVQAGFPCLALMGSSLSEEQEELLVKHFKTVVLMLDGDEAGRKATADCLERLSARMAARVVWLSDGVQPDALATEELRRLLHQRA